MDDEACGADGDLVWGIVGGWANEGNVVSSDG